MTHSPKDQEAARALRELHALLANDDLTESDLKDTAPDDATTDADILEAISTIGMDAMSPEARELLIRLTDYSENLEPATRERLISAAERGLQWRRDNSGPLPVLLFARRRAARLSPEDVSTRISVPPMKLAEIESGTSPVQSLSAEKVAAWIHVLHVDFHDAETALKRGVERHHASPRAAAAAQTHSAAESEAFITDVLMRLRELQRS